MRFLPKGRHPIPLFTGWRILWIDSLQLEQFRWLSFIKMTVQRHEGKVLQGITLKPPPPTLPPLISARSCSFKSVITLFCKKKPQTLDVYFPFSASKIFFPLSQKNYLENRRGGIHGQKDVASVRQFWKKSHSFKSHRSTKLAKAGTPGHRGFHLSRLKPKQVDHADIIYVQPIDITVAACNAVCLMVYMLRFLL